MTREQAAREARKRWGKAAAIQKNNHGISSPEKREAALAIVREERARLDAIEKEIDERLKALDWLQALRAEQRERRKRLTEHQGWAHYHTFQVGSANSMFFHVLGSGDTWEEAFAQADARKGKL